MRGEVDYMGLLVGFALGIIVSSVIECFGIKFNFLKKK
jgi:hypothetical protein